MKVIWVYENTKGVFSFYTKLNITLFVASVTLWKKYHPLHKTSLYADEMTIDIFNSLDILYLWDEVINLEYNDNIDRDIFWSGCKSKVLSTMTEPCIIVDHDFLIFTNIDEHLKESVLYTHNDDMSIWYPKKEDINLKKLTNRVNFTQDLAANVSLLYLPDPLFTKLYADRVIENHKQFTAMSNIQKNSQYLVFSEQYMLKEMLVEREIPHKPLLQNVWSCELNRALPTIQQGVWTLAESTKKYKHYGPEKTYFYSNKAGFVYENVLSYLMRCISATKLINVEYLTQNINKHISIR